MRQVRDQCLDRQDLRFVLVTLLLGIVFLFAQFASLGNQFLTFVVVLGLGNLLAHLVGLSIQLLSELQLFHTIRFELNDTIDVTRNASTFTVLADQVDILKDEFPIKHDG